MLARTSSSGSTGSGSSHPPSIGSAGTQRQNSQSSLFEAFASTAKELVKETARQGSQEGLLAHMDKVIKCFKIFMLNLIICIKSQNNYILSFSVIFIPFNRCLICK